MKVIATEKAPGAIGPYSQGFIAGGFVYTSGQIPVNPADGTVPEGIAAQTEQSFQSVVKGRTQSWCNSGAYASATASISHRTPLGRSLTATQLRAGLEVKYFA